MKSIGYCLTILNVVCLAYTKYHFYRDECQGLRPEERFDCYPETYGATRETCEARGCCWVEFEHVFWKRIHRTVASPYCFFSKQSLNYRSIEMNETRRGSVLHLIKSQHNHWPNEICELKLTVAYETKSRLRLTFTDSNSDRWQVPLPLSPPDSPEDVQFIKDYHVEYQNNPFGIKVIRTIDEVILFDTISVHSPLLYADQFLQISTRVAGTKGFGLGERTAPFLLDLTKWSQIGMWARDQPTTTMGNLYGTHNFFMGVTDDFKAFGIFLLNSNAQEVIVQPLPALTYRTIGGVLDFFIFTGPSPGDVVQQYNELIGPSMLPPYWSLGFHLCRWGYGSLKTMKKVFKRNIEAEIPFDVQWNDIDYMDRYLDWTVDKREFSGLADFVKEIHEIHGMHYVIIIDPAIKHQVKSGLYLPYDSGIKLGVFINSSGVSEALIGEVWPGTTVYPDFTNPVTIEWWFQLTQEFKENQLNFDGMWLDMNEPANFVFGSINGCTDSSLDNPPYVPNILGSSLIDKTICPSADQYLSKHYNLHNMYGYFETVATYKSLTRLASNKRPFILSRSTFPGSGRYTAHWSGDNFASWDELHLSISHILRFNLFGIPMTGADICGFNGDTSEELCIRWMQLGAFYPFMRNHASDGTNHQDPAAWGKVGLNSMRSALNLRYSLIPYIYTLFYRASMNGTTVARSIFFEFPNKETIAIDRQFLLGPAILVSPVLTEDARSVDAYIPDSIWCDSLNGKRIFGQGQTIKLDAPINKINIHQRGGSILPTLPPTKTTLLGRKEEFTLVACLNSKGVAFGDVIWDDGESLDSFQTNQYTLLEFSVDQSEQLLQTRPIHVGYIMSERMTLGGAVIVGIKKRPELITVNGKVAYYSYDETLLKLYVQISEDFTQRNIVKWF